MLGEIAQIQSEYFLRFLRGFLLRFLRLIVFVVLQNMCALAARAF